MRLNRKAVSTCIALTITILGGALPARGQVPDTGLEGVKAVDIIVESLSEFAAKCGVTKSGIDAAIRLPLDASRLQIDAKATPYAYAKVNVLQMPGGCVASVDLSLRRTMTMPLTAKPAYGVSVWDDGSLLTGPSYDFGQRVNQEVEELIKKLIAAWVKVNPK